jgi:hypothetical protein
VESELTLIKVCGRPPPSSDAAVLGIGLYHYNLNVVPTQKKKRGRITMSRLDKMSVTEREVKVASFYSASPRLILEARWKTSLAGSR